MSTETTRVKARSLSAGRALQRDPNLNEGTAFTSEERASLGLGEALGETFAAARVSIENWRWQGVPIYVRTGKAMRRPVTEAVIRFKDARLTWSCTGGRFELEPAGLRLDYNRLARGPLPDAYENVFAEVLEGDPRCSRGPVSERPWQIVDALLRAWERDGRPLPYARGSWGPPEADALVGRDGGAHWLRPARSRAWRRKS